jgi:hypothetical protein
VGWGSHPYCGKEPLGNVPVRLYSKAQGSCAARLGISWNHYDDIWNGCGYNFVAEATTNVAHGQAVFSVVPAGNYLALAKYVQGSQTIYLGASVGQLPQNSLVKKHLRVIETAHGKIIPALCYIFSGSELVVVQPEYVEWSEPTELYPIVYDSVGTWSVDASVTTPEGFVTDYSSLSTNVSSDMQAVQFTVTDVGSAWVPTKIKHRIKHKGKLHRHEANIGVKLTPEMAAAKRVTVHGEPLKKPRGRK